jgi:hypothetical protein
MSAYQSQPRAPTLIPLHHPPPQSSNKKQSDDVSALRSPFFHPSNPRISTVKTPRGSKRPAVVINDVPVKDEEKKSSLLGAYANLCNVTIGAGIVGLVSAYKVLFGRRSCSKLILYTEYCLHYFSHTLSKKQG